jgi:hypothetical protein
MCKQRTRIGMKSEKCCTGMLCHMTTQGFIITRMYLSIKSLIISLINSKYCLHNKRILNVFFNTPPQVKPY